MIVAPFDAELFGHWWFEGPEFLDLVVRKSCAQSVYRLSTPSDVLDSGLEFQIGMPAASSWGAYGHSQVWLNSDNEWIWPHVHHAAREMTRIAREQVGADGLVLRGLNQLARELLLATASDWPFMISMGTTVITLNRACAGTSTVSTGCLARSRIEQSTRSGCRRSRRRTTFSPTSTIKTSPERQRCWSGERPVRDRAARGIGAGEKYR